MRARILSVFLFLLCLLFTLSACIIPDAPNEQTTPQATSEALDTPTPNGDFAVHFIDVGQADAALVICNGKTMLIDGGNSEDSNLIYSYLKKQQITHLDYIVCTHAHEDHVGGLSGALTAATAGVVYAPVTDYDSRAFRSFAQKAEERGGGIRIPKAGDRFMLGDATVTVIGPTKAYDETNDTSIVLRIDYGKTSFLFTGDMEKAAETDLLDASASLAATVLKVGHHGSTSSTSYRFLREVSPQYAVISVGEGNSYNHPNEDVLSRLRDAEVTLYRTDLQGDIICTSNGEHVSFRTSTGQGAVTNPTQNETNTAQNTGASEYSYIGNLNSNTYHKATCSSLPSEENRIYFITKEEAVNAGYKPCGRCDP